MDLALLNAVPFLLALILALPITRRIPKDLRAWFVAGVMAILFISFVGYFPHVQAVDMAYKQQNDIALTPSHSDEADHSESSSSEESASTGDHSDEASVVAAAEADDTAENTATEDSEDSAEGSEAETVAAEETVSNPALIRTIPWVPELGLTLSFYLDGVALLFALIVTGIGAGIFLYAGYYFEDDDDQIRFLTILSVFAGAMLGLVISGNLLTLFIMWEGTSITSFLLIAFKGAKSKEARFGGMQAFIITGLGALALIAGFVLLALMTAQLTGQSGFVFDLATILNLDYKAVANHPYYIAVVILVALGAFTKSAQMPFHFWLPGAMEAPTPASAYLHSATMVKAGIYLLYRLYPPLHGGIFWTQLLVVVGVGTMFFAALFALGQRDLKGLLAYSTVSWLGALVAMIGLPESLGLKAALVGVIAHALYKAALFLSAGTIDHNTGTRIIDELGGLYKKMPTIAFVVIVSALSMAGMIPLFGFVAKEVLLKAYYDASFAGVNIAYGVIAAAAVFNVAAAGILIWDVFFRTPDHDIHYHASPLPMNITPVLLALGTLSFAFFIDVPFDFVKDLLHTGVQKPFTLHLLPDTFTDPVFLTSMAALGIGFVVFLVRRWWLPLVMNIPLPRATTIYKLIFGDADDDTDTSAIERMGDIAVRAQNGQIRYYLVIILGTVAMFVLSSGIIADLAQGQQIFAETVSWDASVIVKILLLGLAISAALHTVLFRKHIHAALALGVLGYAVGGLFLVEPAPDVSLVQFLVETLATILVIVMLSRISQDQRRDVMDKLWKGRSHIGNINVGIFRDLIIAGVVGISVFFFALTALVNRPDRQSIAQYQLENTYEVTGVTDTVGAIVADWRGMDTTIEVFVFAVAALGVLTLLTRGFDRLNPFVPTQDQIIRHSEFTSESLEDVQDVTNINTPFTRMVSRLVLPLTFMVAATHILLGGGAPGDGFTAGAISGLVTALWYVVYGYREARERLAGFAPHRLLRAGLTVTVINALLPVIFGLHGGFFLAHVDYGKLFGIAEYLSRFDLKLTSALIFEIGIALTVFGGFSLVMEAIAHPKESSALEFGSDETETQE